MIIKYALHRPEHGKIPSFRAVEDPSDISSEEVVVEEVPEGWVWDSSLGLLREKNADELLAEAQAQKIDEFAAHAMDSLRPLFTDGRGTEETLYLLAAHVAALCDALNVPMDPKLIELVSVGDKALAAKEKIEEAKTPEMVEEVEW